MGNEETIISTIATFKLNFHEKKRLKELVDGVPDDVQLEMLEIFIEQFMRSNESKQFKWADASYVLYLARREYEDMYGTCYLCKNYNNPMVYEYNDILDKVMSGDWLDGCCKEYNVEVPVENIKEKNDCPNYDWGGFACTKCQVIDRKDIEK